MPSREFPAPPDLTELLKFFESKEGKARINRQHIPSDVKSQLNIQQPLRTSFSKRLGRESLLDERSKAWKVSSTTKPAAKSTATASHRLSKPTVINTSAQEETVPAIQGWNASTQLPPAPSKILRHQLLCRTYQPPAPVYVVPSEANQLLDRLAKGTISSRSKSHTQTDIALQGRGGVPGNEERSKRGDSSSNLTDTRGRDAIQTLLFYRKEVDKRRRLDPNYLRPAE